MLINVYSNHNCPACMMTKRLMKAKGIKFNSYATDNHPDVVKYVKTLGITSAPIVIIKHNHKTTDLWYGFRPERIMKLASK